MTAHFPRPADGGESRLAIGLIADRRVLVEHHAEAFRVVDASLEVASSCASRR